MQENERRLAAIMLTDMVGYTALSQKDEALALQLLEEHRRLLRPIIPKHRGKEVKTIGDSFLVEFASALEAVRCAFEIQRAFHDLNSGRPPERRIVLRVGIHVGDVVQSEGDVYGDAVNVASRIDALAAPGGICITRQVYDQIRNKFELPILPMGTRQVKNVQEGIEAFTVVLPWEKVEGGEAPRLSGRRLAVLPFSNISPDPKDSYFADGLTEELISSLSEVRGLRVIARTSVDHYRNAAKSAKQIGSELNVSHLLEGSVRKAGNRIRITAHLVDTESQEDVWSDRYEKDLVDVFSIQRDIAARVTDSLKVRLLSAERERMQSKETDSIAAYVAYLKGRSLLREGTEKGVHLAREQFELAMREDESYARAYAGMADTVMLLGDYLFSPVPVAIEEATRYVKKALALDPDLAEARVSQANLLLSEYRFEEAEKEFRRAIEINPSYATGHLWYSVCLQCFGRSDEAMMETLLAEELDPLSPTITLTVIYRMCNAGRYAEAEMRIRKLEEIDRESPLVDEALMVYNFVRKDWDSTLVNLNRMIERDPGDPFLDMDLAFIYAVTGRRADALKLVEKLKKVPEGLRIRGQLLSFAYVGLGDLDAAFEWLNYGVSKKEIFLSWVRSHPVFEPVRADPRFKELLRAAHLPSE